MWKCFAERYRCDAPASGATGASAAGVTAEAVGSGEWLNEAADAAQGGRGMG
jgi:hypothetical protein